MNPTVIFQLRSSLFPSPERREETTTAQQQTHEQNSSHNCTMWVPNARTLLYIPVSPASRQHEFRKKGRKSEFPVFFCPSQLVDLNRQPRAAPCPQVGPEAISAQFSALLAAICVLFPKGHASNTWSPRLFPAEPQMPSSAVLGRGLVPLRGGNAGLGVARDAPLSCSGRKTGVLVFHKLPGGIFLGEHKHFKSKNVGSAGYIYLQEPALSRPPTH